MKFLSTFDATVTEEWKNTEGLGQVAWRMFLTRPNSNLLPFFFFFPSGASYYNRSVLLTERLLHGNVLRTEKVKKKNWSKQWKLNKGDRDYSGTLMCVWNSVHALLGVRSMSWDDDHFLMFFLKNKFLTREICREVIWWGGFLWAHVEINDPKVYPLKKRETTKYSVQNNRWLPKNSSRYVSWTCFDIVHEDLLHAHCLCDVHACYVQRAQHTRKKKSQWYQLNIS